MSRSHHHHPRRRLFYLIFIFVVVVPATVHSWSLEQGHPRTPSNRPPPPPPQTVTVTDGINPTSPKNTKDFFIRKSMSMDVGRASQILTDGFFKAKGMNIFIYFLERLETYLSLELDFPKPWIRHDIFVACDVISGQVWGMAEVDARTSGRSARGQDGPYMCNLAVDEVHQRKGIASELVQYCEQQVQQWHYETVGGYDDEVVANSLYLKVRETNKAAVSMYDKLGYRSYRQEKDNKGTTVLVMRKELPKVVDVSQQPQQPQQQEEEEGVDNQVEEERKRKTQVYTGS